MELRSIGLYACFEQSFKWLLQKKLEELRILNRNKQRLIGTRGLDVQIRMCDADMAMTALGAYCRLSVSMTVKLLPEALTMSS